MSKDPHWWNDTHEGTWDRVKSALKRDWEQTKADFTKKAKRHDLNQDVGDTVKQAAGKEAIPPEGVPNPEHGETNWDQVQSSYRYGIGARRHFKEWDEPKLEDDWTRLEGGRSWHEVRAHVRHAWDYDDDVK